jgi:HPt (histidine-containing phosphotransfer) domain-containing protein
MLPELTRLVCDAEQPALRMALHTFKGNAATVGAITLADQLTALEKRCKANDQGEDFETALLDLAPTVTATQAGLAQAIELLGDSDAAIALSDSAADHPMGASLLRELTELLRANDMDAVLRFAQYQEQLHACYGLWCEQLEMAMQDLDLKKALALCSAKLAQ